MGRNYRNGNRGNSGNRGGSGNGGSSNSRSRRNRSTGSFVSSWAQSLFRPQSDGLLSTGSDTGFLSSGNDTGLLSSGNDTGLLSTGNDTGLLSSGSDTGLLSSGSDTGLLSSGSDTGLLSSGSDTGFWGGLIDLATSVVNTVADVLGFDGKFGYDGGSAVDAEGAGRENQADEEFATVVEKAEQVVAQGDQDPAATEKAVRELEAEAQKAESLGVEGKDDAGSGSLLPEWDG